MMDLFLQYTRAFLCTDLCVSSSTVFFVTGILKLLGSQIRALSETFKCHFSTMQIIARRVKFTWKREFFEFLLRNSDGFFSK